MQKQPGSKIFIVINLLYLSIIIMLTQACINEPQFKIKGAIGGISTGMVFLKYSPDGANEIVDSIDLVNGEFTFSGQVEFPVIAYINIHGKPGAMWFFLENKEISISGHIDSLIESEVTGSETQDDYNRYRGLEEKFYNKNLRPLNELAKKYRNSKDTVDDEVIKELEEKITDGYDIYNQIALDFIAENLKSFASPFILRMISNEMETEEIETYLNNFDTCLRQDPDVIYLKNYVEARKGISYGSLAPDFTLCDTGGTPVKLSNLYGNYLLIDFWASWCAPCLKDLPELASVYRNYHSRGFEIVGISLDKDKDQWKKAINDFSMEWINVSDQRGWEMEILSQYLVNQIPANYLLNREGVIIARNLTSGELRDTISKLTGN